MWSGLGRRGESQYNRQNHQVLSITCTPYPVPSTYPPLYCVASSSWRIFWSGKNMMRRRTTSANQKVSVRVLFISATLLLQTSPPVSCGTLTSPWTLRGTPAILVTLHSGYGGPSTMKTASGVFDCQFTTFLFLPSHFYDSFSFLCRTIDYMYKCLPYRPERVDQSTSIPLFHPSLLQGTVHDN